MAVPVVAAEGELVQATLAAFERELQPYVEGKGPGLVIDLGQVRFMSSTALGLFVRVGKTLEEQGRVLVLARLSRPLERLIRTLGLDEVFPLFRTVAEAQTWVAQRAAGEL
jgi:anti-anti-sigma factor